jgi:hypothetical protein
MKTSCKMSTKKMKYEENYISVGKQGRDVQKFRKLKNCSWPSTTRCEVHNKRRGLIGPEAQRKRFKIIIIIIIIIIMAIWGDKHKWRQKFAM